MRCLTALLLIFACAYADDVDACSLVPPADGSVAPPRAGADDEARVDVPTNAHVFFAKNRAQTLGVDAVLVDDADASERAAPVDDVEGLFVVDPGALDDDADYTVQMRLSDGTLHSQFRWHTTTADNVAPGVDDVDVELDGYSPPLFPDGIAGCGPSRQNSGTYVKATVSASDDVMLAGVRLYLLSDDGSRSFQGAEVVGGVADDRGDATTVVAFTEGAGHAAYEAVAVDVAGNESEPFPFDVDLGCPGSCAQNDTRALSALGLLLLLGRRLRRR